MISQFIDMKANIKYFPLLFKDLIKEQIEHINEPFICHHSNDVSGLPYFKYLVIDMNQPEGKQFIARFKDLGLAKEYVDYYKINNNL